MMEIRVREMKEQFEVKGKEGKNASSRGKKKNGLCFLLLIGAGLSFYKRKVL